MARLISVMLALLVSVTVLSGCSSQMNEQGQIPPSYQGNTQAWRKGVDKLIELRQRRTTVPTNSPEWAKLTREIVTLEVATGLYRFPTY